MVGPVGAWAPERCSTKLKATSGSGGLLSPHLLKAIKISSLKRKKVVKFLPCLSMAQKLFKLTEVEGRETTADCSGEQE